MRFYPPELPPFPHEPTSDRFTIERGAGLGEGVQALVGFAPGDIVFAFTGFLTDERTLYSLQSGPGAHVHDPYFMGKVLHHCDPNCSVDMERRVFVARRTIHPGDWVTMDYDQTEDELFRPFTCHCGAAACRGTIRGRLVTSSPR